MKIRPVNRLAAILLGIVFLVSGLMKLQDPVGTMLIVTEYCKFFHCSFLLPAAKVLGQLLALFEATLGVALVTGVLRKIAAWCTCVLLGGFTVITLILWIRNPEMDCGCFGEALHLTHAQSFWKNVILLVLAVLAFLPIRNMGKPRGDRWVAAGVGFASLLFVLFYCNRHLPAVDFTAFNWGAELFASLDDDVTAENHYKPVYVFEKAGQQGSFGLDNLPDSSWTFVRADTLFRLGPAMHTGYPILSFRSADGEYRDALAAQGQAVVFSVYDLEKARWDVLQQQVQAVEAAGATPLVLLASDPSLPEADRVPAGIIPYFADYKTLVTLNRSNAGGSYFCNGELIDKWAAVDCPTDFDAVFGTEPVDLSTRKVARRRIRAQGFLLYLTAVLILL